MELEAVKDVVLAVKGIRDIGWLSQSERLHIMNLENLSGENTPDGFGRRINQGLADALACQYSCAVLNDNTFRHESVPCLQWVVDETVIGEEIASPEQFKELTENTQVGAMGKNFVIYYDRMRETMGRQSTLIARGLPFSEVEAMEQTREVICGSPAPVVDTHLKNRFGWPQNNTKLGTFVLGFNAAC